MTRLIRICLGMVTVVIVISTHFAIIASPKFTAWGSPVNLGCVTNSPPGINSTFSEEGPALSKNGESLFFASNRPTALDDAILDLNLWVAQWDTANERWGEPTYLGPNVNSAGIDNIPSLSRDGHWLFFNSDRPGGQGGTDIWVAWRKHVDDDFGWEAPVNLGPVINTAGFDGGASYFENDDEGVPLLFFGSGPVNLLADLYVSEMHDGVWGTPVKIEELSMAAFFEARPSVRFDGLELFYFSNRTQQGSVDLWQSTRENVTDPWGEPTNLGPVVNSASVDQQPHIAPDRQTLFFVSNRPGGCGGNDIYVTTREKGKGE